MCSLASQTCRRTGLLNCCHGIGTIRTCRWSLELGIMLYAIRGPRRVLSMRRHLKGVSGAPGTPVQVALNSRETVDRLRADIDSGRRGVMVLKRKLMSAKAALDRAGDH